MASLETDLWDALKSGVIALKVLAPILLFSTGFLCLAIVLALPAKRGPTGSARQSHFPRAKIMMLYGTMFGILGALVGVLFSISDRGGFESYVPHVIVVVTAVFQLLGRLRRDWNPPLKSVPTMIGTMTACFVFLFTILYLHEMGLREKLLGHGAQGQSNLGADYSGS